MTTIDGTVVRQVSGRAVGQAVPAPHGQNVVDGVRRQIRVDWAVMAVDEFRDVVALPQIPGVQVVPAITLSFDNWQKYRVACLDWIRRDLAPYQDRRPVIALDDERQDWRGDSTSPDALALEDMYLAVTRAFPWANVMLRGPYQCTAAPWMISDREKFKAHQAKNNDTPLRDWLLKMGAFCPTMYLPDVMGVGPSGSPWENANLREYQRLLSYHHLEQLPVHPMVCPFVDARWDRGAVDPTRLLRFLRFVATTRPDSLVVWGYIGHGETLAANAWRAVMPRLLSLLRIVCSGEVQSAGGGGGVGGGVGA